MHQYCESDIHLFTLDIKITWQFLESRFENIKSPIPDTRSFCEFVPINIAVYKDMQ